MNYSRLEEDRLSYKLTEAIRGVKSAGRIMYRVIATIQVVVKIVGAKAKNICKRCHAINCGAKMKCGCCADVERLWMSTV